MNVPSRFQNVQMTVSQLSITLSNLQTRAPQGDSLATCYTNLMRAMDGNAVKKTADSANHLVNSVFGVLLGMGTTQQKLVVIDRYVQVLAPRSTSVRGMVPPIEQLRDDLLTRAAILGENPIAIRNHFTNIIESIQSIVRTYDLINGICAHLRPQIAQGANVGVVIQRETWWLAAVTRDFLNFDPDTSFQSVQIRGRCDFV